MTGTVGLTQAQENGFDATLTGDFNVTSVSGDSTFTSAFPAGSTVPFQWALDCVTCVRTLSQTVAATGFLTADPYTTGTGSISAVPLPPALYLFGSALGEAFWMSRRKRSAITVSA